MRCTGCATRFEEEKDTMTSEQETRLIDAIAATFGDES
jgi:hypothetical protein